ncbi:MAG: lysine--tRNA ligase [Bacteroidetes bacterium]|nr:lysine--tRNA ligase [Bacteroidota bacterium]
MMSIEEIKEVRLKKLEMIKAFPMDPYPAKVERDFWLSEVKENFKKFEAEEKNISIVGRVMTVRGQGAILFCVLNDGTASFQAVFKKDEIKEELFKLFVDAIDMGDFLQVSGTLFVTQKGEESLLVKDWKILSKSLLPMPEKWAGIQDDETRLRKRYLDLLLDNEKRDIFYKKAKFWEATREFLKQKGFLEIETPTLEVTTGGAEANPFKTHHKDFDLDVFLRISVGELWQKRLMAGGFSKTFEIGRVYRNEGSSPEHLQEFTNMEFYSAYSDYNDGMNLVQDLYRYIAKEVFGRTDFETRGHKFDLAKEWEKIDYISKVKDVTGIDVLSASESEMKAKLTELGVEYDGENRERLVDTLWKYCRKTISGPAFLINHPKIVSPLSKSMKDNPELTERFQVIIAGSELGNGFSELNDPIDQEERFKVQEELIERGDDEAMMADHEFVEMLEHGMPPTCGFGFGERFFAFLMDKPIRETQLFPLVKPRTDN